MLQAAPTVLARIRAALTSTANGLSLSQLQLLLLIGERPGLSVIDAAEALSTPQQSISRHLAVLLGRYENPFGEQLVEVPLARLEVNSSDPRRRAVYLTDEGEQRLNSYVTTMLKLGASG